ncbi:hypothetical protein DRN58_00965 [Thermococci archaeon]|nr:MAG: hypothetical protein DRN58_00965 [Thermococci archaeon]
MEVGNSKLVGGREKEEVMIDKYEIIRQDVLWVLKYYGSDLGKIPKEEQQAERIVEFIRQLDMAEEILEAEELGLVRVIGQTTKIDKKGGEDGNKV